MHPENPMQRTPLQTLLEERLRSARGLGWDMEGCPPFPKGGRGDFAAGGQGEALSNPPRPLFMKGGGVPRWFRVAVTLFRCLKLVRG